MSLKDGLRMRFKLEQDSAVTNLYSVRNALAKMFDLPIELTASQITLLDLNRFSLIRR